MDEKSAILIIAVVLGYILSFLLGYFVCKSRGKGLAGDTGVCDQLSDSIEGSSERADRIEDRIESVIESGSDIEDIFLKYARESEENAKLEQDTDRDDGGVLSD